MSINLVFCVFKKDKCYSNAHIYLQPACLPQACLEFLEKGQLGGRSSSAGRVLVKKKASYRKSTANSTTNKMNGQHLFLLSVSRGSVSNALSLSRWPLLCTCVMCLWALSTLTCCHLWLLTGNLHGRRQTTTDPAPAVFQPRFSDGTRGNRPIHFCCLSRLVCGTLSWKL